MIYDDYIDAGFRVIQINAVKNGKCTCGKKDCKNLYKHPKASNWQNTPRWSDEQLDTMRKFKMLEPAFGVLCNGYIVIDVDPRNGGDAKQVERFEKQSGFVVETGGGGLHIYFKSPDTSTAFASHLDEYKGIDFKTSGFVIGAGSMHVSGNSYEIKKGNPHDITEAPQELIDLIKRKEAYRTTYNGHSLDITDNELKTILSYYPNNNLHYDDWLRVGMCAHHATGGAGYQQWVDWSATSSKHNESTMPDKWHSFGKSETLVTIGTLIFHAQQNGYQIPVTFKPIDYVATKKVIQVDLLRPPALVGKVTEWINSQCRYPREHLAVAAAISSIGNIGGPHKSCEVYGVTANQFIFCVSASATGKEAIQQAQIRLHQAGDIAKTTYGAIKSEQEIIRNLMRDRCSNYVIDEIGYLMKKIVNSERSGASYLEGVIALLMSTYSKANSFLPLGGDLIDTAKSELNKELKKLELRLHDGEEVQNEIDNIKAKIKSIESGIKNPFLSLIGYTTPITFDGLVTEEQATNGFFGRSLIIRERETNPKGKKRFKPCELPMSIELALKQLSMGDKTIPTTDEALLLLDQIEDELHEKAEHAKTEGLEAIVRRSFELILKTSLALAMGEGVRTLEHVEWAKAYIDRDTNDKTNLAAQNIAEKYKDKSSQLQHRIIDICSGDTGETIGVIKNKAKAFTAKQVEDAIKMMIDQKMIIEKQGAKKVRYCVK